ncbi:MAG: hypothetical protein JWR43_1828, partial [Phenylobacterium sp.]|nr:hypothetical protein [Phenylobacterium sp.]
HALWAAEDASRRNLAAPAPNPESVSA